MNVLSLFDGMSVGRIALDKVGIVPANYYASEVDKHALKVSKHNWKDITHVGDVTKVSYKDGVLYTENGNYNVGKIDLLIGGSPCQTVSLANRGGGDVAEGKSKLFFEYVRILGEIKEENKDVKWLLENVKMKKTSENTISEILGKSPIAINSNLFSIQNRERLYWTNMNVDMEKLPSYESSPKLKSEFKILYEESLVLTGHGLNKLSRQRSRLTSVFADKCPTLMKSQERKPTDAIVFDQMGVFRYPTRSEMEIMQTVPEGYTDCLPYNYAAAVLGNGWTSAVIEYIFQGLKK